MTRFNHVKSVYNQIISKDILVSLGSEGPSEEELEEKLRQLQEENAKLEEEQRELFENPPEEVEQEEPQEEPEEEPEEEVELEPEEEVPEGEKVEMPGQLEKGQLTWVETETGLGALKKYSPNSTLAKTCPICGFNNRPIYLEECQNCKKVYHRIKRFIDSKRRRNKNYTPDMAFEELAKKYKYIGSKELREIYFTGGKTKLPEINEIEPTPRKQLQDMIWYRLNVKKDPKTGEPLHDKSGMPIPLDDRKYFSTEEITNTMHISPEKLREMVANHNAKIINNLPEEAKKLIKRDQTGEIIPSSARQLDKYGYVAPAVIMGTGMADVRRRLTQEQQEKLTPEQLEGLKGPSFKSIDIAAWNWDKLKPVFGWDEKSGDFTGGWMKFLRDKFLPAVAEDNIKRKIEALQRVIDKYQEIVNLQEEDVEKKWMDLPVGLRMETFFHYNPELTIDEFKDKHTDQYKEFKKEYRSVINKKKFDNKLNKEIDKKYEMLYDVIGPEREALSKTLDNLIEVQKTLENFDKSGASEEETNTLIEGISRVLKVSPEVVAKHLEMRDKANEILLEMPTEYPEMEYMMLLERNPDITLDKLKQKYDRRRAAFEKNVWNKIHEVANQFKEKAERLKDKLPELEEELEEAKMPKSFNLADEVKKYYQEERALQDQDPQVEVDLNEAEKEINKEKPKQMMPNPEDIKQITEKKSSRLKYITKLAVGGQLGLFGPEPEEEKEEEVKIPSEEAWRVKREPPKIEKTIEPEETFEEEEFEEELPEPELDQEEKAVEAPAENFGKEKGKYFVYFEWTPDYPGQPNAYKSFFAHTPGRRSVDFEELLKSKIESRFGPKISPLMHSDDPELPDKTTRKYIHITVIEPTTERRRRFGATVNRETGEISWHGTGGAVERREKERRLNLEQNKELKKEVNLGLIGLDNLKIVGNDDLEVVEEQPKGLLETTEEKKKLDIKKMKERKERAREERGKRLKEISKITPEQREKIEEEKEQARTKFTHPKKEYTKPSGEQGPETPIRKVVTTRDYIKKTIPKIDPVTKKVIDSREVVIPKIDHFLITIRLDDKGNPKYAKCDKISMQQKHTGPLTESRPAFETIYRRVTDFIDEKRPELRGKDRRELINKLYERIVKENKGEEVNPYKLIGQEEFHLPEHPENMNITPYKECPASVAPFEKACPQIKAALDNMKGEETTGFEVRNWDEIPRSPSRETSKEMSERQKKKDVTPFHS